MRILKRFLLTAAILIVAVAALAVYLLRGGFRRFDMTPYPVSRAAFTNWNDVLAHPRDISLTTFQTGVVHMDACLNLDPASPGKPTATMRRAISPCWFTGYTIPASATS
jgi:hypothetical protein